MHHFLHLAGLDAPGPVRKRGDARSALVQHAFAAAVGAVVGGQLQVRNVGISGKERGLVAAVVAHENNQRIFAHLLFFQRGDHLADFVVHARDHGRVGAPRRIFDMAIFVDVLLRSLIRRVGSRKGEVKK